ncbi:hypothetical protein [Candidatus Paracaedibacter symbiosus]|uniref:hypothetical protein n=1 Tax=Candidatus Paracaedibacter symbiosus TaxID=244582 RepID=UPI0005099E74|nr:hypothetical protein [Candidatus Paracaedibacter symbiosus]
MLALQKHIIKKQNEHRNHSFFEELDKQEDFFNAMDFAVKLTFWVMAFQDILRLIPPRINSKALRRIATHHKVEDGGHNLWFLQDINFLNKGNNKHNNIAWLFSKENEIARDFSYRMISEVFNLAKDHEKITLILALESGGHVFFEKISNFVKLKGYNADLKYFSSHHLEVEKNHAVFEESLMKELVSLQLNEEERLQAIALVDRFYEGINTLFDQFYNNFIYA